MAKNNSEKDNEAAPRFRNRPIEVTLYENKDDVGYNPAFEGQTSSVSRQGVGVRVNPKSGYKRMKNAELEGEKFYVQFHTGLRNLPVAYGTCTMVGDSEDMRYKTYLGFEFEDELPLMKLIS